MGAWEFVRPHLLKSRAGGAVRRVARPRSASPAEGSAARHALNQQLLVNHALEGSHRRRRGTKRVAELTPEDSPNQDANPVSGMPDRG